jgi:hypothetical protein
MHTIRCVIHFSAERDATQTSTAKEKVLYRACRNGFPRTMHKLLELGVDPNAPDPDSGRLPLHSAIKYYSGCTMINILVEAGADVYCTTGCDESDGYPFKLAVVFLHRLLQSLICSRLWVDIEDMNDAIDTMASFSRKVRKIYSLRPGSGEEYQE